MNVEPSPGFSLVRPTDVKQGEGLVAHHTATSGLKELDGAKAGLDVRQSVSARSGSQAGSSAEGKRRGVPVFVQDWWLDTACKGRPSFDIRATVEGRQVGQLRYICHRNKIGARLGQAPFWSHLGGPVLVEGLSQDRQRQAIRQIAQGLPRDTSLSFVCNPNAEYADIVRDEFMQVGFALELRPTFLHSPTDSTVLDNVNGRHRKKLRRASKRMLIGDAHPSLFMDFYAANLPAPSHSPLMIAGELLRQGIARGQARATIATASSDSEAGPIDAAIACTWDADRYYYWLSARRRQGSSRDLPPNPDATKLLILAAVDHARALGLVFDADSPETAGGRALFETVFGFTRVEYRNVLTRRTAITAVYDRVTPTIKTLIKTVYPKARIHAPKRAPSTTPQAEPTTYGSFQR